MQTLPIRTGIYLFIAVAACGMALPVLPQCSVDDIGSIVDRIKEARTPEQRIELARTLVSKGILARYQVPGLSAAVAKDGKVIWSEAFGFADVESKTPATTMTRFRVGSISKVFTAGAVGLLYEQGKLDLDVPVQQYVSEFPKKGTVITTRQLTGHLAGIRHYKEGERDPLLKRHFQNVVSALDVFKDDQLVCVPGEKWSYTSFGWTLVSAIVERASGQHFLDFMQNRVFEPLGMKSTCADDFKVEIPHRSTFYEGYGKKAAVAPSYDLSSIWAGGGFLSTSEDMVRYGSAYLPGASFLKSETLSEMLANQKTSDGQTVPHGIGWFVDELDNGKSAYYHGGTIDGGHSILLVRPDDRIVVAMAGNHSSGFDELEANLLASIFLGATDGLILVRSMQRQRTNSESKDQLFETLGTWKESLKNRALGAAISVVSVNFTSPNWIDKQALKRGLETAFKVGSVIFDSSDGHLGIRGSHMGARAYLTGAAVNGALGSGSAKLTLEREPTGWKVVGFEIADRGGTIDK